MSAGDGQGCHVLLIEDDKVDQLAFKRFVRDAGLDYVYRIAGSVAEARAALAEEKFDVVVTDYALGDGTAFDVVGLVKGMPKSSRPGRATRAWP